MGADQLTIETARQGETEILRVKGPLTLSTLFDFQDATKRATNPKTIVDLTGVPYMDSSGLGCLLSYHAACQRARRNYALAGVAPRVMSVIEVSRIDSLLHIFPTVAEAESYLAEA